MAKDYEVTHVNTTTRINERGELEDMYEVYFVTASGDSSYVRFPRILSAEEMEKAIEAEARKLLSLHPSG